MMIKLEKFLTTIVFLIIVVGLIFLQIDTVMKFSAAMLVLIYWELEDILRKLD